jgi:plasmid stability protein
MRTARTLEAEWRQVLRESVGTGQKKMNQVLGAFGLLDFTMLLPVLPWRTF